MSILYNRFLIARSRPLDIAIDRNGDIPVYRQLIEKVAQLVREGSLNPGDKLPTERELSARLGIARGTITKAYEELARSGMLEVTQGRGTFVSARQDVLPAGRKDRAVERIRQLISELVELRFSYREIRTLVELMLLDAEQKSESLNLAAVDCSPEALRLFGRQLGFMSRISIHTILLDDLARDPEAEKRLAAYDLVLTTATHYSELLGMAPAVKERLVQAVVSPSQETIISLAGIRPGQRIGILCQSRQFRGIIERKLAALRIADRADYLPFPEKAADLDSFAAGKDAIIVPPDFAAGIERAAAEAMCRFTERGGRVIPFDYQIERGSLVYLEERIRGLLER